MAKKKEGHFTLPEKVRRANPREEIERILLSNDPTTTMAGWENFKVSYETMARLKKTREDTGQELQEREEAFDRLLFLCVPTICAMVNSVRGLGVSDIDLTKEAFSQVGDIIEGWEVKSKNDNLRGEVHREGKRALEKMVTKRYGLILEDIETVRLYFQALEAVRKDCGYGTERRIDLETIRRGAEVLIEEWEGTEKPKLFLEKTGPQRPLRVDLLALIHDGYFGKDGERLSDLPDRDCFINPGRESDRRELRVTLEALIDKLPEEEQRVLFWRFDRGDTLEEIAGEMDLRPEVVRQIEAKALRRLRHPKMSRFLRDFL